MQITSQRRPIDKLYKSSTKIQKILLIIFLQQMNVIYKPLPSTRESQQYLKEDFDNYLHYSSHYFIMFTSS